MDDQAFAPSLPYEFDLGSASQATDPHPRAEPKRAPMKGRPPHLVATTLAAALSIASPLLPDAALAAGGNGGQDIIYGQGETGKGGRGYDGSPGANVCSFCDTGGAGGGGAGGGAGGSVIGSFIPINGGAGGTSRNRNGADGADNTGLGFPFDIGGGAGGGGGAHGSTVGRLGNASPLRGGNGGDGGNGFLLSGGGGGGAGGYGAVVTGNGSNTNASLIRGGNGGNGGAGGVTPPELPFPNPFGANGGSAGDGGIGILFTRPGASLVNRGAIIGGNGGAGGAPGPGDFATDVIGPIKQPGSAGAGGEGIVGSGLSIVNAGRIKGGLSGDGTTRADAIRFEGGANRLELQAGSTIVGNVVVRTSSGATGALVLGGSRSASFDVGDVGPSAHYRGFSAFAKTGSSHWTLTGSTDAGGPWSVTGGLLSVNGALPNARFAISGSTIGGGGTIGGLTVGRGGTVAPGNSIGVLNVAGNVTFNPGSTFQVEIDAKGRADRLDATGTATLRGGTVRVLAGSGSYRPGQEYVILTADGGVRGRFASLATSSNLAFLKPTLSHDEHSVTLELARRANFRDVALTRNQWAVAGALDRLGPDNPLVLALLNQSVGGARSALSQLSGDLYSSAVSSSYETAFFVREAILDRLRWGSTQNGFESADYGNLPARYSADLPGAPASPALVPARVLDPTVFGLWGQGFGAFGQSRTDGNAYALSREILGFVFGADMRLENGLKLGATAGYTETRLNALGVSGTGTLESGFGGVYGGYQFGAVSLRAGAVYHDNSGRFSRQVAFPGYSDSLSTNVGGAIVQGFGEAGYRIALSDPLGSGLGGPVRGVPGLTYLEPFIGGSYVGISRDRFQERGGAAALTAAARDYDIGSGTIGLRGQSVITLGASQPLALYGLVGYRRSAGDIVPTALLAFGTGPLFVTAGLPIDRDAVVASAGVNVLVNRATSLGIAYTGQAGARAQDHAVKGNLTYRW